MLNDFKAFALRGNVIDLAVAVIIGGAFGKFVDTLLKDIVMPPLGMLVGNVDFSNLYINLSGENYSSLEEATAAGAPLIRYGHFITELISFVLLAFIVFLLIRGITRLKAEARTDPTTRECPYCCSTIAILASRCPSCTASLNTPATESSQ